MGLLPAPTYILSTWQGVTTCSRPLHRAMTSNHNLRSSFCGTNTVSWWTCHRFSFGQVPSSWARGFYRGREGGQSKACTPTASLAWHGIFFLLLTSTPSERLASPSTTYHGHSRCFVSPCPCSGNRVGVGKCDTSPFLGWTRGIRHDKRVRTLVF